MDIRKINREAWDKRVREGDTWTRPVTSEQVAQARQGEWAIYLTPCKAVPKTWYPPLQGADVLGLASGGGQQGPLLAAAGANVTIFDNSPAQLAQDRMVAERDGLSICTVEGDMRDLSIFPDASFDLIIHPVSNVYVPDILPVWQEAARVLRVGGSILSGFDNPDWHIFDWPEYEKGQLVVKNPLPTSTLTELSAEGLRAHLTRGDAIEYSHTLEEQIGGQISAGLAITGMYEDRDYPAWNDLASKYIPNYFATRATKL